MTHFETMDLSQSTLSAIDTMGFETPTPVQQEAIPRILDGQDVAAQARTGTGKTAAFGIPLAEKATPGPVRTLVLAPTRELANQIKDELNRIGHGSPLSAFAVYGGVGYGKQRHELGPNGNTTCVVACPGRLLDLLRNDQADLSHVDTVVFDEADRMLDMGFVNDIEKILRHVPDKRQTLLFSATMPDEVHRLSKKYMTNPQRVEVDEGPTAQPLNTQYKIPVRGQGMPYLLKLLEQEDPERTLVFAKTKHTVKRLAAKLNAAGYDAGTLQGNMSQNQRDRAMNDLRKGKVKVMVATDVAARGLDVDDLTHVIQFDMPTKIEDHVHRTGRTGRAGAKGRAFLFVPPNAKGKASKIEQHAGVSFEGYDLGTLPTVPENVRHSGPKARRYETITAGGQGTR